MEVDGNFYTPQLISGMILCSLKDAAEEYLGCEVKEAVITVPAYFNEKQRKATKEAGEMAGLHIRRIINEPTAAAMAQAQMARGTVTVGMKSSILTLMSLTGMLQKKCLLVYLVPQ